VAVRIKDAPDAGQKSVGSLPTCGGNADGDSWRRSVSGSVVSQEFSVQRADQFTHTLNGCESAVADNGIHTGGVGVGGSNFKPFIP